MQAGADLRVHDPEALANVRAIYGDRLVYCDRPYGALEQADALVVVTEWNEFRNPDFEVMRRLMRQPVIFDGRNVFDPARMAALGFTYQGIGRAAASRGMNPLSVEVLAEIDEDRVRLFLAAEAPEAEASRVDSCSSRCREISSRRAGRTAGGGDRALAAACAARERTAVRRFRAIQHLDGLSSIRLGSNRDPLVVAHRSAENTQAVKETSWRSWRHS